jgi:hypothetical protein
VKGSKAELLVLTIRLVEIDDLLTFGHSVKQPLGAVYTMDHEVIPRPSKPCDWTLKSSRDDLGLHQGKNGKVTTEVEVHNFFF